MVTLWPDHRGGVEEIAAPLPLYHSYAFLLHCLAMPYAGNLSVLIPNPRDLDSVMSAFVKHKISGFVGINTLYLALLEHPPFCALDFAIFDFVERVEWLCRPR